MKGFLLINVFHFIHEAKMSNNQKMAIASSEIVVKVWRCQLFPLLS